MYAFFFKIYVIPYESITNDHILRLGAYIKKLTNLYFR